MKIAIKEALKGVKKGDGGPFGAVVVRKGKIISKAHNEVLKTFDPTAHAEVLAIRQASKKLKNFDLSDCEIYSSCEPCPMCLAAIHWGRIKKVFFGASRSDAEKMGFSDKEMYDLFKHPSHDGVELVRIPGAECACLFDVWRNKKDKKLY